MQFALVDGIRVGTHAETKTAAHHEAHQWAESAVPDRDCPYSPNPVQAILDLAVDCDPNPATPRPDWNSQPVTSVGAVHKDEIGCE